MSEAPEPKAAARSSGGLSPTLAAWLVAGAAFAFLGFLAAMAYQPDLAAGADQGAQAMSRSPAGYAGLVRLLREDGETVRINRRRDPRDLPANALLVLTPRMGVAPKEIMRLARGRRVLLVSPKWLVAADPHRPGRVMAVGVTGGEAVAGQAAAVLAPTPGAPPESLTLTTAAGAAPVALNAAPGVGDFSFTPGTLHPVTNLRTLSGPRADPVLVDASGRALLAVAHDKAAYVLADPDLIDNQAMGDIVSARAGVSLVEALADDGPVVFDMTLTGLAGAPNPLKLAFEPPFVPATVSFVLAVALLGLSARARFGAVRTAGRAYGFGKRALADSAASLLAVAGREPRLAPRYVGLARASAVAAAGLPPDLSEAAQAEAIDRIGSDRGAGPWSALATEASAVRTPAQLMSLARRADRWRREMTHGRG